MGTSSAVHANCELCGKQQTDLFVVATQPLLPLTELIREPTATELASDSSDAHSQLEDAVALLVGIFAGIGATFVMLHFRNFVGSLSAPWDRERCHFCLAC